MRHFTEFLISGSPVYVVLAFVGIACVIALILEILDYRRQQTAKND